jgi:CHAT domain-containing protein/tetratricopeptide (TPR) repeat protein
MAGIAMEPIRARVRTIGRAAGGRAGRVVLVCCLSAAALAAREVAAQTPAPTAATPPAAAAPAAIAEEVDGSALVDAGKLQDGLEALARAEGVYRERRDRGGQARVAQRQAAVLRRLARVDEATAAATRALSLAEDQTEVRIAALTELGLLANDRGDTGQADAWLQQALPLAEQSGDAAGEAVVLRTLGRVRDTQGKSVEALAFQQRSIAAADRAGAIQHRVAGRSLATVSLLALARYDEALALAEESLALAQQAGASASVRGDALFTLAQAHGHVWNLDRAAELWAAAIEAHSAAGNTRTVALATKQSVDTSFARGDFDRAVADGERAVDLLRQARYELYLPETLARLALSEARRGRLDAAREWAARARTDVAAAPESRHIFVYNDLGLVSIELGDLDHARADFARVSEVAARVGNTEYEWRALWGLGRAATAGRDRAGARESLERAIAMVERLRETIPDAGMRATFMTNRVAPYETLVEATMGDARAADDGAVREALHVAERARSRALADLLAEARARPSDPRLQAIREREVEFGRRLTEAGRRAAAAADPDERTVALAQLRELEHEYDTFVLGIRRDNAGYAALAHPRALAADDIARMLAPDEALVEFLMTDKRGFAWVVRPDNVQAYDVPGQDALVPRVRLLQALVAANDGAAIERLGADLHERLLAPAAPALGGVRRLIVVPDGVLQRVPFALLRSGDRWLVERYTLSVAPSATVLDHLRAFPDRRAERPLLALAAPEASDGQAALFDLAPGSLPRLSFASQEAADARVRLRADPRDAYTGTAATEAVLKSTAAAGYRIVHLAAHAIVDEVVPRRSAVLLTPGDQDDGLLRVSEIANLQLHADLVVLAACRSNVGRLVRGEGLLSLSRAFLHAGARSVVATAWMVDDRDTAWLMDEFYGAIGEGLPPDEALQRAQRRAIAAGGRRADPATWSAFLIVGDARGPIVDPVPPITTATSARGLFYAALVVLIAAIGLLIWTRGGSWRSALST